MKNIIHIIFFSLIILTNTAYCQFNYIQYSHYVNNAELSIADKKYSEALVFYDSVVSVKSNLFAKDALNAAICAGILKNNNMCYAYLKLLIDKGIFIENFKSINVLSDFLKTKIGKKLIDYSKHNDGKFNKKARYTIDSLEKADQFFRNKKGKYVVYMDTIKKIDANNALFLVKFIEMYGFPNEDMVGIVDDSLLNFSQPLYYGILIHQQNGSPSSVMNFSEILTTALKNGDIEPNIAVELIDKSNGSDEYGSEVCGLTKYVFDSISSSKNQFSNPVQNYDSLNTWGYINLNLQYETKLNNNRNNIGLGTVMESFIY